MSVENDPGFWKWLAGGIASVGGTMFGYHKFIIGRIDKKADKGAMIEALDSVKTELGRLRDNDAKLFDQIRNSDQRAQDRHERLMEKLK
jgi:hypothetical protein